MKRISVIAVVLFLAIPLLGLAADRESSGSMESRVFEVVHREPGAIASSIALLGSSAPGSDLSVNEQLRTITVRDYPENLAAIEGAIRRLDVHLPAASSIYLQLYVLIASNEPNGDDDLPGELNGVVSELKSALRYENYSLMTSALHQTRAGRGVEGSGVADSTLVPFEIPPDAPIRYRYTLSRIGLLPGADGASVDIDNFRFSIQMPIRIGDGFQYSDVGFETPVMIRENEKVVVGTTAMGDKAVVVVVTASTDDTK